MSSSKQSADSTFLFETKASIKSIGASALFGLGGLAAIALGGAGIALGKLNIFLALLIIGGGIFGVVILVYELKHLKEIERYYTDRAERRNGENIIAALKYADGIRFDYAVAEESGEAVLGIRGGRGTHFEIMSATPGKQGNGLSPSLEKVQQLRDILTDYVAAEAIKTIKEGKSFRVDKAWHLAADGVQIDGEKIPWDGLGVRTDDSTGDVILARHGIKAGVRNMMDDNVIPALEVIDRMLAKQPAGR